MTKREKEFLIAGYNSGLKAASTQAFVDADACWKNKKNAKYYLDLLAEGLLKDFASLDDFPPCSESYCVLEAGHELDGVKHKFFIGNKRNDQKKEN